MGALIEITNKGFLTLPVSTKHHNLQPLGVSAGGPMDSFRAVLANRLVGNADDAFLLEATFLLPGIRFSSRTAFAVVGGLDAVAIFHGGEKRVYATHQTLNAEPGDELLSCPVERGMRAYLAFSGGLEVKSLCPEPVSKGERLTTLSDLLPPPRFMSADPLPLPQNEAVLRVIEGTQADHFSEAGLSAFYKGEYCYSPKSDRMGILLFGPPVSFSPGHDGNILSEAVRKGDIQIPADGQPILLMAGCQTSGGYAKIAHVISADIPIAAQLRPGAKIHFKQVSVFEAQAILHRLARKMEESLC